MKIKLLFVYLFLCIDVYLPWAAATADVWSAAECDPIPCHASPIPTTMEAVAAVNDADLEGIATRLSACDAAGMRMSYQLVPAANAVDRDRCPDDEASHCYCCCDDCWVTAACCAEALAATVGDPAMVAHCDAAMVATLPVADP